MTNTHLDRYQPDCQCNHCRGTADKAHQHYQRQTEQFQEQIRRSQEMVPPPLPPIIHFPLTDSDPKRTR